MELSNRNAAFFKILELHSNVRKLLHTSFLKLNKVSAHFLPSLFCKLISDGQAEYREEEDTRDAKQLKNYTILTRNTFVRPKIIENAAGFAAFYIN